MSRRRLSRKRTVSKYSKVVYPATGGYDVFTRWKGVVVEKNDEMAKNYKDMVVWRANVGWSPLSILKLDAYIKSMRSLDVRRGIAEHVHKAVESATASVEELMTRYGTEIYKPLSEVKPELRELVEKGVTIARVVA